MTHYLIGTGFIEVRFKDGSVYRYDYPTTGQTMVDEMSSRARAGWGLHRYITKVVKSRYAYRR